jgi:acetyl-CoA carboxylase, biotin carboxylase subunit
MFARVLVANRGEIALRIIRACHDLGIEAVAVYSEADDSALHVSEADHAICIGPPLSAKSYLNTDAIIEAARESGASAIHPGYGYLSEKAEFAEACANADVAFIGPTPANLRLAGDKIAAKKIMMDAGVPVIPSSPDGVATIAEAMTVSEDIGYPVMVKASGGGGGRGIRICADSQVLAEEFSVAKMEARAAFGNDTVYIEKVIQNPRHIEFQILADSAGRIIHLGERECTIQRRYQKLIEESPSPYLDQELREAMGQAAVAAAKAVQYVNAGTIEFLVDPDGHFYFMEVNSRIQVEHPVTELTTGIDLVREQIFLASGRPLSINEKDIRKRGWAIECRINAEDPEKNFLPSPGIVDDFKLPGGFGVRIDTHLYKGYELPIFYDSLLAKLVTFDRTRLGAIGVMKRALRELTIGPIKTTIPFHLTIMNDPDFIQGEFDTSFVERFLPEEEAE